MANFETSIAFPISVRDNTFFASEWRGKDIVNGAEKFTPFETTGGDLQLFHSGETSHVMPHDHTPGGHTAYSNGRSWVY